MTVFPKFRPFIKYLINVFEIFFASLYPTGSTVFSYFYDIGCHGGKFMLRFISIMSHTRKALISDGKIVDKSAEKQTILHIDY